MSAHKCHVPGCDREIPPHLLMCLNHWKRVPQTLRNRVWKTYRKGQEIDKNPSPQYIEAAKEAIACLKKPQPKQQRLL